MHRKNNGAIAQLVEQRTENPCVPGSIPGGTTAKESYRNVTLFWFILFFNLILDSIIETLALRIMPTGSTFRQ